jgi:capsular exopolysaccharide synthesis family protein
VSQVDGGGIAAVPGRGVPVVAGPAVFTPALPSTPDAHTLLKALKRRWLLALTVGLLCAAGAGAAAWLFLPAKSTVFALVLVSPKDPLLPRDRYENQGDSGTFMKTVAARIKHRHVLNNALKKDEVKRLNMVREQPEPIQWLEDELKVELTDGSEIVKISMTGYYPGEMLTLVDAVTNAYLDEMGNTEREGRAERLRKLEGLHTEAEQQLRSLKDAQIKQAEESGTHLAPIAAERQRIIVGTWSERQKELNRVQADKGLVKQDLESMAAQAKKLEELSVPEEAFNRALESDPIARRYTEKKVSIEEIIKVEYENKGALPSNSSVKRLRGTLEHAQTQLDKRKEEIRTEMTDRFRKDALRDLDLKTMELQKTLARYEGDEKALTTEVADLKKRVDKLGKSSAEMEVQKTEIAQQENLVSRLKNEWNTLQTELKVPPRVNLYQSAAVQRKDIKRQLLATILAPVSAFAGVCLVIGWWEHRGRRVHSADEVVTGLGLRLVGAVPPLSAERRGRLVGAGNAFDPHEHNLLESIDGIRTVLLRDATVSAMRVVMVTSATSGEGKTTLAGHLAVSLARAGRRTLLLDCDLRQPAAHQLFEQALQPGLSEVLLKEIDLTEALRPTTALEGLWLLPAGQWDREVLQALAQEENVQHIFERLRSQFDFIVIDSSPVLAATDSLLVGQHVDGVILSLLRDQSQVPLVHGAVQRLTSLGIRVLGAVVNGLKPEGMYGQPYHVQKAGARAVTTEQV